MPVFEIEPLNQKKIHSVLSGYNFNILTPVFEHQLREELILARAENAFSGTNKQKAVYWHKKVKFDIRMSTNNFT